MGHLYHGYVSHNQRILSHSITVSEISSHPFLQERKLKGSPKKFGEKHGFPTQVSHTGHLQKTETQEGPLPPGEVSS